MKDSSLFQKIEPIKQLPGVNPEVSQDWRSQCRDLHSQCERKRCTAEEEKEAYEKKPKDQPITRLLAAEQGV